MAGNSVSGPVVRRPAEGGALGRVALGAVVGLVVAVVSNVIVWALARALFSIAPEFLALASPAPAIVFTTAGVIGAAVVFAIMTRVARRPLETFTTVAVVVLARIIHEGA
jgi:hypothetical protein